ncbi:hypothetical protein L6452_09256 [Arctium lappa]|uniref:Uncharacterized protein n=1 Tax=Arctium lappa TaxID=4217 RepID=A0ACB9DK61_ARCLA|nr:hypothetical protein L6452_09256 [Arctium lappa]
MAVTDFFVGEIADELLKMLITITRKVCLCKPSAEQLLISFEELLPTIAEIKYSVRFDRLDGSNRRLEQRLGSMKIGGSDGGWWSEDFGVKKIDKEEPYECSLLKVEMELGKRKVKDMKQWKVETESPREGQNGKKRNRKSLTPSFWLLLVVRQNGEKKPQRGRSEIQRTNFVAQEPTILM